MNSSRHIRWENDRLVLLDQTLLPGQIVFEELNTSEEVWKAIKDMKVRGAPAIGIAAAYGLYLGIKDLPDRCSFESFYEVLEERSRYLAVSRPTAVNLFWALERMKKRAAVHKELTVAEIKERLLAEAIAIHEEDGEINRKIGENLLTLLEDGMGLLTHCNAGALATSRYGTATAPIYLAKERGRHFKVYAGETRPRLQGSALTAFELQQAGIDVTVITDSMAAVVMSQGKIDAVIVGCDRVAANGDVANKIGTLGLSILSGYYRIPFYVATPTPTIDLKSKSGGDIPIEERDPRELSHRFGVLTAPENVHIYNPSFDVTPHENITAIVTEKGIIYPPYPQNLWKVFKS